MGLDGGISHDPRRGQDYRFFRPPLPEDRISVRYRLDSVEEKASRDGRGQLMVVWQVDYTDGVGQLVATNHEIFFLQPIGVSS